MSENEMDGGNVKPFAAVLQEMNKGRTHTELSTALQDVVMAVLATHKKGTVTLQIDISKSKAMGMVELTDTVKVKLPEADRSTSMFYVTDDGNLTREDPKQMSLPLAVAEPIARIGGEQ